MNTHISKHTQRLLLVTAIAVLPAAASAGSLIVDGQTLGSFTSLTSAVVNGSGDVTVSTSGFTAAGGGSTNPPPPAATYTIGGTVSGLSGSVTLVNNGADPTTVTNNGAFSFATKTSTYAVSVSAQPSGQTCSVANGTGTATANVASVSVNCVSNTTPPPPTDTPANVTIVSSVTYPMGGEFFDLGPKEIKSFPYIPAPSLTYKRISSVQQSTNGATRTVWVSTSPGGSPLSDGRCTQTGLSTTSYYGTGTPNSFSCQLTAGQRYYVNVQNATTPNGTTSTCTSSNCGFVLTVNGTGTAN